MSIAKLNSIRQAAKYYASLGLSPIPLKKRSKVPTVRWKNYDLRLNDFKPSRNIAVKTGGGLVVIDFDESAAFARFVQRNYATILKFPIVKSGRGYHVYVRTTESIKTSKFNGGDIKGENSLIVAPPSIHPNGKQYTWLNRPNEWPIVDDVFMLLGEDAPKEKVAIKADTSIIEATRATVYKFSGNVRSDFDQDVFETLWADFKVYLKPGDLKYLCPFHDDKSPSLQIDSYRCIFYCFACEKGGGIKALQRLVRSSVGAATLDTADDVATPTDDSYPPEYAMIWGVEGTSQEKCGKASKVFWKDSQLIAIVFYCGAWKCEQCAGRFKQRRIDTVSMKSETGYVIDLDNDVKSWDARQRELSRQGADYIRVTKEDGRRVVLTDAPIEGATLVEVRPFLQENIPDTAEKNPISTSAGWRNNQQGDLDGGWVEVTETWLSTEELNAIVRELGGRIGGFRRWRAPQNVDAEEWKARFIARVSEREEEILAASEELAA